MFGLRTRKTISKDLEDTTAEIERLTLRVKALRKELNTADKDPEIQAILEAQPIGAMLRNGTPATPQEVVEERLDTDFVSLHDAGEITETYIHLRASLNVRERNVSLPPYGDDSMTATQVMRKLYASETLRELLRYKNEDIGKFIVIDRNGYVSLLR